MRTFREPDGTTIEPACAQSMGCLCAFHARGGSPYDACDATEYTIADYTVGEVVEVHSFGRWYAGTIVKIGRSRITVDYTAGRGARRIKVFDLGRVRKLESSS